MNQKTFKILTRLRNNGRESLTSISKNIGIPVSSIYDFLKDSSFVKKYTSILNYESLGFHLRVMVLFKAKIGEKDSLKKYVMNHLNCNSLYMTNSGYDFIGEMIFKNIKESEIFIDNILSDFAESAQAIYLIDELVKEKFLSDYEVHKAII